MHARTHTHMHEQWQFSSNLSLCFTTTVKKITSQRSQDLPATPTDTWNNWYTLDDLCLDIVHCDPAQPFIPHKEKQLALRSNKLEAFIVWGSFQNEMIRVSVLIRDSNTANELDYNQLSGEKCCGKGTAAVECICLFVIMLICPVTLALYLCKGKFFFSSSSRSALRPHC